jgi:hypothetical protein
VGDLNTPLLPINKSSRQISTSELNYTINQIDLTDIYRIPHPTATEYTFFLASHGTFSKKDLIIGHKAILNKCKKIEIIFYIFSDHNELKLESNNNRNCRKYSNTWRLNNSLLIYQWVIGEIRREVNKILE